MADEFNYDLIEKKLMLDQEREYQERERKRAEEAFKKIAIPPSPETSGLDTAKDLAESYVETPIVHGIHGATMGLDVPTIAALRAASDAAISDKLGEDPVNVLDKYKEYSNQHKQLLKDLEHKSPAVAGGSEFVSGLFSPLPGSIASKVGIKGLAKYAPQFLGKYAPAILENIGQHAIPGAAIGAISGAATSSGNAFTPEGRDQMLSDTLHSTGAGAVLGSLGNKILPRSPQVGDYNVEQILSSKAPDFIKALQLENADIPLAGKWNESKYLENRRKLAQRISDETVKANQEDALLKGNTKFNEDTPIINTEELRNRLNELLPQHKVPASPSRGEINDHLVEASKIFRDIFGDKIVPGVKPTTENFQTGTQHQELPLAGRTYENRYSPDVGEHTLIRNQNNMTVAEAQDAIQRMQGRINKFQTGATAGEIPPSMDEIVKILKQGQGITSNMINEASPEASLLNKRVQVSNMAKKIYGKPLEDVNYGPSQLKPNASNPSPDDKLTRDNNAEIVDAFLEKLGFEGNADLSSQAKVKILKSSLNQLKQHEMNKSPSGNTSFDDSNPVTLGDNNELVGANRLKTVAGLLENTAPRVSQLADLSSQSQFSPAKPVDLTNKHNWIKHLLVPSAAWTGKLLSTTPSNLPNSIVPAYNALKDQHEQIPTERLPQVAEKLRQTPGLDNLADKLDNALQNGKSHDVNAAMFSIQQRPDARKALFKNKDTNNNYSEDAMELLKRLNNQGE